MDVVVLLNYCTCVDSGEAVMRPRTFYTVSWTIGCIIL